MKNKKLIALIIIVLLIIISISVGFSLWTINHYVEITPQSYNVISLDDVSENESIDAFTYDNHGFVNINNNSIIHTNSISIVMHFTVGSNTIPSGLNPDLKISLVDDDLFINNNATVTFTPSSGIVENITNNSNFDVTVTINARNTENFNNIYNGLINNKKALINVTSIGDANWTINKNIALNCKKHLNLVWSNNNLTYNGENQSVYLSDNSVFNSSDYSITYSNNTKKDADLYSASATITFDTTKYGITYNDNYITSGDTLNLNWEIRKANLTISADNKVITYNDNPPTYSYSISGNFEDLSSIIIPNYSCTYSKGDNAGNYIINISNSAILSNYNVTYNNGTLTVNQKELSLSWNNLSFVYDGTAHIPTPIISGVIDGDVVNVVAETAQTNVGNYTATASLTGEDSNNYKLPNNPTASFEITNADITGSISQNGSLTYNGVNQTPSIINNLQSVNNQIINITYSTSVNGTYSSTIPSFKNAGTYKIYYKAVASNHNEYSSSFDVIINKLELILSWEETSLVYSGSAQRPNVSATNICGNDVVTIVVTGEQTSVGNHIAVASTLSGADSANYKLPSGTTQNYTIGYKVEFNANGGTGVGAENGYVTTSGSNNYTTPSNTYTAPTGYNFNGWKINNEGALISAGSNMTVSSNITLYAQWTEIIYTITWKQDDDTLIDTTQVAYNDLPTHADPTKASTAQYDYTFAGWSPTIVKATKDATYKATYSSTIRSYTITWKQDDGSIIDATTVSYGDIPTHTNPTKASTAQYTYTFNGWSPTVSSVTQDAIYTATFIETVRSYTITGSVAYGNVTWYIDSEHQVEITSEVDYGTTVYYIITPNEGYIHSMPNGSISLNTTNFEFYDENASKVFDACIPDLYTINYSLNGGSLSENNPSSYTSTSETFTLNNPERDGYIFNGWTGTGLIEPTITVTIEMGSTGNRTYQANWLQKICYNYNTGVIYTNISTALDEANTGEKIYVYIGVSIDIDYNITIPSGVELVLPFIGKHYKTSETGNNVSNTPLYKIEKVDDYSKYGNTQGDINAESVNTYRSILFNMKNGFDIVVNGSLSIGGATSTKGNNGYYSEINLSTGSSITILNGGTLNSFGYIKENSVDYKNIYQSEYNNYMSNSFDSDRYLSIESGAILNTYLALYDAQSQGPLTGLITANQPPFNCYDLASLQTYTIFKKGCEVNGSVIIFGPNEQNIMKDASIIKNNNSLFIINNGSLEAEYMPNSVLYTSRNAYNNKTRFIINGSVSIGYIYISEYGGQVEVDTRNYFLPVSCKTEIYIKSNSTLTTDKTIKFLMGSKLFIDSNATFAINNKVAFYDSTTAPAANSQATIFYNYTASDSILINNGTIIFNTDSNTNGALGAKITHTSTGNNAKINLTSISSEDKLTVTVPEGTTNITVSVTSSGLFNVNDEIIEAHFTSGTIFTSGYSNSNYFWVGDFASTYRINVEVDDTVINPIYNYSIKLSENSNGSNSYESELSNKTEPGFMEATSGLYFNITYSRAYSIAIYDDNNNLISYSSNMWYEINQNYRIFITPNEGIKINVSCYKDTTYNDKEDKWSQGLGHTFFYIQECSTQGGTYEEILRVKDDGIIAYVQKGFYFKVGYTWDSSDLVISGSGNNGFTAKNRIYTNNTNFAPQPNNSWNNDSTSSLSPAFLAGNSNISGLEYYFELGYYSGHAKADEGGGDSCLLATTEIMLSDGTIKYAKDLIKGDKLLTFNHFTGTFDEREIIFNVHFDKDLYDIIELTFANGNIMTVASGHGLYNVTNNTYEIYYGKEFYNHIGEKFIAVKFINSQPVIEITELINVNITKEYVEKYSPLTEYDINCIADGMLSIPDDIEGMLDLFKYTDNYTYDLAALQKDIDEYGVYTYDEFKDSFPEYGFNVFNIKYWKPFIEKGELTSAKVNYWIEKYLDEIIKYQNLDFDFENRKPFYG